MLAVSACGQAGAWSPGQAPHYTVTTSLMQKPGERAVACFAMPLPEPPIGCGGPPVVGLDLHTLPGFQRYRNGVESVGMMRLIGIWEAGELRLTARPQPESATDLTPTPRCDQTPADASPDTTPEGRKLMSDESLLNARGIQVLEFYVCKQALFVVVSVADKPTVDFMNVRYAPVQIAGWMRPVG